MTAVVGILGSVLSFVGQQKQAAAMEKAEKAREKQMNLDVQRKKRAALREAIMAQQTALNNATAQGAQGGSGLPGGQAQVYGNLGRNTMGLNQDQQLGSQVFAANRQYAAGGSLAGFGSMLSDNAATVGRVASGFSFGGVA